MYETLKELINEEKWESANLEFEQCISDLAQEGRSWDDEFAILAAAVYGRKQEFEKVYDSLVRGLTYNYKNCELYLLLGTWYERMNPNQAFLCYENAEFYCDNEEDLNIIRYIKNNLLSSGRCSVAQTSIVILSYNHLDYTKGCIHSIKMNNPETAYELIIVDNNSTDGSQDWLQKQKDIKLLCNGENKGFPAGCNQGIKMAEPENDIFLLNNDTVLTSNALFWLRMGLYESERVGAAGSVTNYAANNQMIGESYDTLEEYIAYGIKNNIPAKNPYEKKLFLVGFAVLIRRRALDEVGLLDLRFSPGFYEDNDLGLRLLRAGWQQLLCWNSFIYHYGSGGGDHTEKWNSLYQGNALKLADKWKFNMDYYRARRDELIDLITDDNDAAPVVLEVGCGLGATLARIQYLWPKATVRGIELVERVAQLGAGYLDIIQGDIETMELPYERESLDYIILGDVLEHLRDPWKILERLKPYLKEQGCFLCSLPNMLHVSAIGPLLQGRFDYKDSGIQDRSHLRFFTLNSICQLCSSCGLEIEAVSGTTLNSQDDNDLRIVEEICDIPGVAPQEMFMIYQYIFRARKIG